MFRLPVAATVLLLGALSAALMSSPLAAIADDEATPIALAEPFPADIPVNGTTIGAPDAPVEVVVWGDYTCPGCGRFARESLPRLVADFVAPGLARVTFRDYAFRGPDALRAAEAAACAADQDAFWPYHRTLFLNQEPPGVFGDDRLIAMARALGLDVGEFTACLQGGAKQASVARSIAAAKEQGLDSVPRLFVDGVEVAAWDDYSTVKAAIERALAAPRPAPGAGVADSTPPAPDLATPAPLVALELVFAARTHDGAPLDDETARALRETLQRRMDALGISGGIWRRPGNQILVRIESADPVGVIRVLAAPALLELIDPQGISLPPGTVVATSLGDPAESDDATPAGGPRYETIVSGADLRDAYVTSADGGGVAIGFELRADAARRLYDYTSTHVGQPMSIVLDKEVISSPVITGAIAARGIFEGIPPAAAPGLVAQLDAGALAVPLDLVRSRRIAAPSAAATPVP